MHPVIWKAAVDAIKGMAAKFFSWQRQENSRHESPQIPQTPGKPKKPVLAAALSREITERDQSGRSRAIRVYIVVGVTFDQQQV